MNWLRKATAAGMFGLALHASSDMARAEHFRSIFGAHCPAPAAPAPGCDTGTCNVFQAPASKVIVELPPPEVVMQQGRAPHFRHFHRAPAPQVMTTFAPMQMAMPQMQMAMPQMQMVQQPTFAVQQAPVALQTMAVAQQPVSLLQVANTATTANVQAPVTTNFSLDLTSLRAAQDLETQALTVQAMRAARDASDAITSASFARAANALKPLTANTASSGIDPNCAKLVTDGFSSINASLNDLNTRIDRLAAEVESLKRKVK